MATLIGLAALALLCLLMSRAVPRRRPAPVRAESLTASLAAPEEEYLAWLADHHWPADEYLDLEREWRALERAPVSDLPRCPHCDLHDEAVWPCPDCGRLLHPSCGHGVRHRPVVDPYWTLGANTEPVTGEWLCTGCATVVGLDVADPADPDREDDDHRH
ncbi:hypothetical protein [Actinomadura flavalba]|uniref:hypothetical protein n=1 Tax=Actinomadura flavalba TaxID=1120938 RepID=UPI00036373B7|nr:hypothetical protein [Actinomadura flavalba]